MITAAGVRKVYKMGLVEVHALRGIYVDIEKGEFVGIMGSSGSGKSTLLHMLGLLDRPTEGRIAINGRNVLEMSDEEKGRFRLSRFGFIFQDYALVPELTALENVILPAMAAGRLHEECIATGESYLGRVGLGERGGHLPSELSGGEQQRVAIARALVNNPSILFADEPCANLDSANSRTVLDLFREINETLDQTVVMVSHEEWHREYFDRIIRLKDGLVAEEIRLKG
ncbi:ABC transporter related protein [Methanolacinia petrolearia DSM 11571]|uniref:ABC transporter related protein n=1 Tax=Methanolacinia petrolearia (strain DSM 11571 / OCM 486 / SEBR 4847) TaxID=679926 RepID=E1RFQ2_METP4|nr:ABC transporter ATP-binding protein [Methanolacinia petrolearia]ADN37356.1 ABC transporter related protein [Methanolacinia petrolearia DSM 11571]